MPKDKEKEIPDIAIKETSSTLFVDNLLVAIRSDNMAYLRFATELPEGMREEARMVIPVRHLKKMIDVLCRQCDYFPERKPTTQKTSKGKK